MFTMQKGVFKIAYVIQSKFLRNCRADIYIYMYMFVSWKKEGKVLAGVGHPYRLELPLVSFSNLKTLPTFQILYNEHAFVLQSEKLICALNAIIVHRLN